MTYKIILFVSLLVIFVNTCKAVEFNYSLNYTKLPFSSSVNIMLNGIENLTINISYGNFTSGVNTITFSNASEYLNININVTNTTQPNNYTDVVRIDGGINYSTNINFNFFIINESYRLPTTSYIEISINEFEYMFCDYLLPWNNTKKIIVNGYSSEEIYTTYNSNYFTLPNYFTIPSEGFKEIDINMHLDNLSAGYYTEVVSFSVVSNFSNITIHFDIKDCVRPYPECDEMERVCGIENKTTQQYIECKRLEIECSQKVYEALLEAQEKTIINNTIIEYVNYTERVPVLDLSNAEVIKALKELPTNIKQLINDNRNKDNTITSIRTEIDAKNQELESLRNENTQNLLNMEDRLEKRLARLIDENMQKQDLIMQYDKSFIKKSSIVWWIVIFSLISLSVFGYYKVQENMLY